MKIIDGRKIADNILAELKKEIELKKIKPCLAIILVGKEPSSVLYIRAKEKAATRIGVKVEKFFLSANSSQNEILEVIKKLNNNPNIDGILIQLPLPRAFLEQKGRKKQDTGEKTRGALPKRISPDRIIKEISPKKDVDGLLPKSGFDSPFILSILEALIATKENLENKKITALVNSEVFGERLVLFFGKKGLKVEKIKVRPFHLNFNKLTNIYSFCWARSDLNFLKADVLITALGKPGIIDSSVIKEGVILIDGGISRVNNKTAGDIDAESVKQKAKWISPVPGGLGPLTVAFLLKNLLRDQVSKKF